MMPDNVRAMPSEQDSARPSYSQSLKQELEFYKEKVACIEAALAFLDRVPGLTANLDEFHRKLHP